MSENIYYSPGDYGLSVVAEIDYSTGDYEFDTRVVWADINGKLYTARDSGCSCPTPFEDYDSLDKLDEVDGIAFLRDEADRERRETTAEERLTFKNTVAAALMDPASVAFEGEAYLAQKAADARKSQLVGELSAVRRQLRDIFPKMPTYSAVDLPSLVPDGLQAHDAMVLGTYLMGIAHAAIQQGAEQDAATAAKRAEEARAAADKLKLDGDLQGVPTRSGAQAGSFVFAPSGPGPGPGIGDSRSAVDNRVYPYGPLARAARAASSEELAAILDPRLDADHGGTRLPW